jgi:hypothetical protein
MTHTCHLKEPSIPFATVTGATLTLDDGITLPDIANASIGMKSVDGKLMSEADFDAIYAVDAPLA